MRFSDFATKKSAALARLLPWAILGAGLAATYVLQDDARRAAQAKLHERFLYRSSEVIVNIENRLHSYEKLLQGVPALLSASQSVTREEFRQYVDTLDLERNYPGIQGIGVAQLLMAADKPRYVAALRKEGFPQFAVRPEGERPLYSPITFIEPFTWRNQRAFGFDMYAEPVRREAMQRARDTNRAAISGKLRLLQETEDEAQAGFVMYAPVYRDGAPHATPGQRRAALLGWAFAPFRMNDLMAGLLARHFGEKGAVLDLEIYDGAGRAPAALLYDSSPGPASLHGRFESVRQIDVGGHRWTVALHSLPDFDAKLAADDALLIAGAGTGGSVLLALIVWLLVTGRSRAIALSKQMTGQLRQREQRLDALFDNMSSGVAVLRVAPDGSAFFFTDFNRAAELIDEVERAQVIGQNVLQVFPGLAECGLLEVLRRVWQSGIAEQVPAAYVAHGKISGWREHYVYKLPDGSLVAIYDDVSERIRAEKEQRRMHHALRLLSEGNMALIRADDEHRLLTEICRLVVESGNYLMAWVGYAEHDAQKTVRPMAQAGFEQGYLETIRVSWADTELGRGPTGTAIRTGLVDVNQNYQSNPRMAPWRVKALRHGFQSGIALPLAGATGVLGALTIYSRDPDAFSPDEVRLLEELANDLAFGITSLRTRAEREAAEGKLAFLAHHDALTSLPNRLLLRDRFEHALAGAEREHASVAMLFLDLDHFKQINDSLGHACGDQLLVQAVERLKSCIRDADTISRQGGDEFIILLSNVGDLRIIGGIAQGIIEAFAEPFEIQGCVINTSFSIGISLFPDDGREFETLLKKADTALYDAKERGRNTYRFFIDKMNLDTIERMRLQGQLHGAVKNAEFLLHYQPQIDIESGRIVGVEALVRWQHPDAGMISPATFIPLAERSGMIIPIGEWVLNEACRQAQEWRARGLPPMVVAVNLSALQFNRGNILETVSRALERSGLPPGSLELELTESILLHDIEMAIATLHSLRAMGVKLSIDDFGTGYSSLSYLKRLAVDKLKIDQSFVRNLADSGQDAAIVKAIIQLGHTMQMEVIAEGVETEAQLAFLGSKGCDQAQGYLFSRPVPAAELAQRLEEGAFRGAPALAH